MSISMPRADLAEPATARPTAAALVRSKLAGSRVLSITLLLALALIILAVTEPKFFTYDNIVLTLVNVAGLSVLATGLTFVLLTGGFDLSIGSMLALAGFVLAWLVDDLGIPIVPAMILTVLFGAAAAAATNGIMIGRLKLSFMIVTLGTMTGFQGLVDLVSKQTSKPINSAWLANTFSFGEVAKIPYLVILAVAVFAIAAYVLRFTLFGRDVYAVGSNPKAARLSGINVTRTTIAVYAIVGACAALGGIIVSSRTAAASPTIGNTFMLQAAAAVLIGGTSLRGGSGSVLGTLIGTVFFGVLSNGLQIAGLGTEWQEIVSGIIIAGAALADRVQRDGWSSLDLRLRIKS